jgi:hypothetical protein
MTALYSIISRRELDFGPCPDDTTTRSFKSSAGRNREAYCAARKPPASGGMRFVISPCALIWAPSSKRRNKAIAPYGLIHQASVVGRMVQCQREQDETKADWQRDSK